MSFKDYQELIDPLVLPISGTVYRVLPVGIADGIRLKRMLEQQAAGEEPENIPDDEFNRMLLGDAYDRMVADNVPGGAVTRAALTALADFQRGRAVAEVMWETGGDPKALETWVTARVKKAPQDRKAPTTRRRASTTTRTRTPSKTA